jgi:hypothetical protein
MATVTNSTFYHNQALGGNDNTAGSGDFILGWGHGGAISNSNWLSAGPQSTLIASNLTITDNQAVGGTGNTGAFAGEGNGGGLENWFGGRVTISDSMIADNQAIGGQGVAGGKGGDGFGGGISNVQGATLTVSDCAVDHNQAFGG